MKYIKFIFLCTRLGSYLKKEDICFRTTVHVQERVAMSL